MITPRHKRTPVRFAQANGAYHTGHVFRFAIPDSRLLYEQDA